MQMVHSHSRSDEDVRTFDLGQQFEMTVKGQTRLARDQSPWFNHHLSPAHANTLVLSVVCS